jgi:hypothetical protein
MAKSRQSRLFQRTTASAGHEFRLRHFRHGWQLVRDKGCFPFFRLCRIGTDYDVEGKSMTIEQKLMTERANFAALKWLCPCLDLPATLCASEQGGEGLDDGR